MNNFSDWILGVNDFPARWTCGHWTPLHGWIHIISDILVWGAYMTIPIILLYFLSKRKDLPFPKILWLFAIFIAACGTGHLLEAIIYWVPIYRIAAINKALTAAVSWGTVFALIPIVPFALSLRSSNELQREIDMRIKAEEALRGKATELENINEQYRERQDILESKTQELERMNKVMLDREMKMIELKIQIKELQEKLAG